MIMTNRKEKRMYSLCFAIKNFSIMNEDKERIRDQLISLK